MATDIGTFRQPRVLLRLLAALFVATAGAYPVAAQPRHEHVLSFAGFSGGSALKWLAHKGFVAKQDAETSKVQFSIAGSRLILEAKRKALALLLNETDLVGFSRIRIEWGVDEFPAGASYEKGVRAESVMVYLFFGNEKISSGSLLIPNSPYFIGLFLCSTDPVGRPYLGRYFKAGGRYVCADQTTTGKTVITEFAIDEAFRQYFRLDETPFISGIGIAIDTDAAKGNGTAKAFIQQIEFLK